MLLSLCPWLAPPHLALVLLQALLEWRREITCSWTQETGKHEPLNLTHTRHWHHNLLPLLLHKKLNLRDQVLHNGVGVECVFIKITVSDKYFCSAEASLEAVSQTEVEEPAQPSDEASLPSTSQEPSSSSAGKNKHLNYANLQYLISVSQTLRLSLSLFQTQAALSLLKSERDLGDSGLVVVVLGAL